MSWSNIESRLKIRGFLLITFLIGLHIESGKALKSQDPESNSQKLIMTFSENLSFDSGSRQKRNKGSLHFAQDRMDAAAHLGRIDPSLLQAVLEDPILLRAVDPRVLQAVLVSAAEANLALEEDTSNPPTVPLTPAPPAALFTGQNHQQKVLGGAFGSQLGEALQQQAVLPQLASMKSQRPRIQPSSFDTSFETFDSLRPQSSEFKLEDFGGVDRGLRAEKLTFQDSKQSDVPRFGINEIAQLNRGFDYPSGSLQAMFHTPTPQTTDVEALTFESEDNASLETSPKARERFEIDPAQQSQQLNIPSFLQQSPELIQTLAENPEVAKELALQLQKDPSLLEDLGITFGLPLQAKSAALNLPTPQRARQLLGAADPGVCSLVTATGIPCDPGLAFSPLTGSCEWPDLLMEVGCNPEVVTGFGPCPQDSSDPLLTPAQVASWPQPKFPVNLDVVSVQNFDAVLAKKYFVVCVPTIYGKLFPRLICCPDFQFFDPFHIDGCLYPDYPPPPQYPPHPPLSYPTPIPPPSYGLFSALSKRSLKEPSIEILEIE